MRNEIRWSPKMLKALLILCNTDVRHFSNDLFPKSGILLYNILQHRNNISEDTNKVLTSIFYNDLKLNYSDVLKLYEIIKIQDKCTVAYKKAVAEKEDKKHE
jgi:hypothetical protein